MVQPKYQRVRLIDENSHVFFSNSNSLLAIDPSPAAASDLILIPRLELLLSGSTVVTPYFFAN